tara:strand:+ start:23 stop:364 length:342 start_codon:yes stop_codon:yes gene_type:complete
MAAVYVSNIVINQGADFSQVFNLADASNDKFDLTGFTLSAQMRKHAGSSISFDLNPSFVEPRIEGGVRIVLTDEQTSTLKPGRYVYDILITDPSGIKTRVVEGSAIVREGVTR